MVSRYLEKYKQLPTGLKAAFWYTFANFARKAINMVVIPIYTRLLPTEQYGIYSVFVSWVELFEIICTFRLFYGAFVVGLIRFEDDRERFTSSLEKTTVLITTTALLIYLLFQKQINGLTGMTTSLTLAMFLMVYALPVVGFWSAIQRVDNAYRAILIVVLSISLLTPLCGILCIFMVGRLADTIIYSRVGVEVVVALIILATYRRYFIKEIKIDYCKYALSMSLPLVPFYLSMMILNHSDRIVIQHLVGNSEAGIYSVAYSAAMVMGLFNTAFDSALQPWLFKQLKRGDYGAVPQISTISVVIVAVLNLLLISFAPEAIGVLAPPDYHEAIRIIPPLSASVFVMFYYQRFINVEFYYGESRVTSAASIVAALLNLVMNYLLIPVFGYLVAGYTTLICYGVCWFMHYFCYRLVCRKNNCPQSMYNIRHLMLVTVVFFLSTAILTFGYRYAVIRYIFIGGVGAFCVVKGKTILQFAVKMVKMRKE